MLSVVFVDRKAVDFKDKKCRLRGRNYQKKAAIVGALERIPQHFYQQQQLAYCTCKQLQMRRSAVELRRSHSFIPLKAASIPAKNRLGSMKNSLKKQSRNS